MKLLNEIYHDYDIWQQLQQNSMICYESIQSSQKK